MAFPIDRLELVDNELSLGESDTNPLPPEGVHMHALQVLTTDRSHFTDIDCSPDSVTVMVPVVAASSPNSTLTSLPSINQSHLSDTIGMDSHATYHTLSSYETDHNDNKPHVDIVTGDLPSIQNLGHRHALKPKDICLLLVFSVVSIFLFFPTGIVALYYALKTERMFTHEQLNSARNGLAEVVKMCRRAERFIVLSFVLGLFIVLLVFIIIENRQSLNEGFYAHGAVGVNSRTKP